ncbi:calmodulin-binding receptor-like cytoplasmic kinase 2 [Ricinus communis]|uniref:non-specific serine/threonine protein kinase n=1 Tax=Ricinus communis TaxID=3988 RepID=B9RDU9_RICCO|nr:calmodulin-binding receptor-like cytoplasmic kinase 2 [Ricinus communis]EEF50557.1 ATP binding protein, putative [Ricinus communis]|eukprot:XP_002511888.1 calmodulin-binding receptor-like cytoplasmic kinase 2 [Ricinus communis]
MTSPNYMYGRRNARSVTRSTPDHLQYSPSSSYSDASTVKKQQNPLAAAAKSLAGVFVACFTPPEPTSSTNYGDSGPPSVVSDGSRDRRRSSGRGTIYGSPQNSTRGRIKFTMDEIYKATRNFSPSSKIGQGGFGTVYKGRLNDGTFVAIKRAKKSVYDKHLGVEFQSEIRTLAQVEHLNLVNLYGFLEHEDERIVVVEYVPNGTLREHLDCMHRDVLDLATRLDIAIDVAHAVTYLHMYTDHPIIHRDIKSSNILLTENFRAKVADFGFARLAADAESGATHVSTQVKGTAGYLDPEYLKTYQLTDKSDVYSFGVLLVELVTGRRPIEPKRELKERITARWAMKKFSEGDAISTLDPRLERTPVNNLLLEKILELALQCLALRRQSRPSMKQCVEILWGIRKDCKEIAGSDFRSFSSNSRSTSVGEG